MNEDLLAGTNGEPAPDPNDLGGAASPYSLAARLSLLSHHAFLLLDLLQTEMAIELIGIAAEVILESGGGGFIRCVVWTVIL